MRPLTRMFPRRDRTRARTRRHALIITLTLGVAGCAGNDGTSTATTIEAAVVPDETALAPGECDPAQTLTPPQITTGGTTTPATLGIGDFDCGGLNGDGYISFNYNPVLIEGEDTIEVSVDDRVTATISWTGNQPFTESGSGRWKSELSANSCNRLTIEMVADTAESVAGTAEAQPTGDSGAATATYGADIRVGGDGVDCPQRAVDPSDPSDGDSGITNPTPQESDPQRTDPETTG